METLSHLIQQFSKKEYIKSNTLLLLGMEKDINHTIQMNLKLNKSRNRQANNRRLLVLLLFYS